MKRPCAFAQSSCALGRPEPIVVAWPEAVAALHSMYLVSECISECQNLVMRMSSDDALGMQVSKPDDVCQQDTVCALEATVSIVTDTTSMYDLASAVYWATANNTFQASSSVLLLSDTWYPYWLTEA